MKYIVYKTTNLINGKVYVGVHRTNPDIFDGYIGCGITKKDQKKKSNNAFPNAVKKYGYHNFKRETLYVFDDTEEGMKLAYLKEAEIVNIEWVKSNKNYNMTVGGKFTVYNNLKKKIAQYTLEGKFIRSWASITEAQETLNLTSIKQCLSGNSKYCGDFQWRYYTNECDIDPVVKYKTIYQFDLQGNLLKSWRCLNDISEIYCKQAICNNCNNITRQAYGFYWSYKNKFDYNPYKATVAVAKYDDDGNFIESYTSITDAALQNNIKTKENIIACIAGRQKHCCGFRWRYFYGDIKNIKALK